LKQLRSPEQVSRLRGREIVLLTGRKKAGATA